MQAERLIAVEKRSEPCRKALMLDLASFYSVSVSLPVTVKGCMATVTVTVWGPSLQHTLEGLPVVMYTVASMSHLFAVGLRSNQSMSLVAEQLRRAMHQLVIAWSLLSSLTVKAFYLEWLWRQMAQAPFVQTVSRSFVMP